MNKEKRNKYLKRAGIILGGTALTALGAKYGVKGLKRLGKRPAVANRIKRAKKFLEDARTQTTQRYDTKTGKWVDSSRRVQSWATVGNTVARNISQAMLLARRSSNAIKTGARIIRGIGRAINFSNDLTDLKEFSIFGGSEPSRESRNIKLFRDYGKRLKKAKDRYERRLVLSAAPNFFGGAAGGVLGGTGAYKAADKLFGGVKGTKGFLLRRGIQAAGITGGNILGHKAALPFTQRNLKRNIIPDKKTLALALPSKKQQEKIKSDPELYGMAMAAKNLLPDFNKIRNAFPKKRQLEDARNTFGVAAPKQLLQNQMEKRRK
jgi:hypothetical protein